MTNIEELRELLAKATEGPWQYRDDYTSEGFVTIISNVDGEYDENGNAHCTYDVVCRCEDEYGERLPNVGGNVRLIVALRNNAPTILDELTALRDEVAELTEQLGKARGPYMPVDPAVIKPQSGSVSAKQSGV